MLDRFLLFRKCLRQIHLLIHFLFPEFVTVGDPGNHSETSLNDPSLTNRRAVLNLYRVPAKLRTLLITAARTGNMKLLEKLCAPPPEDFDERDVEKFRKLSAFAFMKFSTAKSSNHWDIAFIRESIRLALQAAATNDQVDALAFMLQSFRSMRHEMWDSFFDSDRDRPFALPDTLIHSCVRRACEHDSIKVMEYLVLGKCSQYYGPFKEYNQKNIRSGQKHHGVGSAFTLAIQFGSIKIVDFLMKHWWEKNHEKIGTIEKYATTCLFDHNPPNFRNPGNHYFAHTCYKIGWSSTTIFSRVVAAEVPENISIEIINKIQHYLEMENEILNSKRAEIENFFKKAEPTATYNKPVVICMFDTARLYEPVKPEHERKNEIPCNFSLTETLRVLVRQARFVRYAGNPRRRNATPGYLLSSGDGFRMKWLDKRSAWHVAVEKGKREVAAFLTQIAGDVAF
jgi:hypothetical protein